MLVLDPDDLGLDRRPCVRYWGCVGLVVEVRLLRCWEALPWVKGRVLLWLSIVGVVCNLLWVLLWLSIAGVMRGLLRVPL